MTRESLANFRWRLRGYLNALGEAIVLSRDTRRRCEGEAEALDAAVEGARRLSFIRCFESRH